MQHFDGADFDSAIFEDDEVAAIIRQRVNFARRGSTAIAGRSTARSTPTRMFRRGR